jgi:hypothetical protein
MEGAAHMAFGPFAIEFLSLPQGVVIHGNDSIQIPVVEGDPDQVLVHQLA